MNRLACLLVLIVTVMLAGCSVAIIHPPSAATFMEKSDGNFVANASVSAFFGDLVDDELYVNYVADGVKEVELMLQTALRKWNGRMIGMTNGIIKTRSGL